MEVVDVVTFRIYIKGRYNRIFWWITCGLWDDFMGFELNNWNVVVIYWVGEGCGWCSLEGIDNGGLFLDVLNLRYLFDILE